MMRSLIAASALAILLMAGAGWVPAAVAGSANKKVIAIPQVNATPRQKSDDYWRRSQAKKSSGSHDRYQNDESRDPGNANGFREETQGAIDQGD